MKFLNFFIFFLFCSVCAIHAQLNNYKQGYIITLSNDTVYGQIDFRTDAQNTNQCHFRETENSDPISYTPSEIISYRLPDNGKYYVSKEITIEGQKQSLFVEYLIQGRMDVYSCNFKNKVYYFFEKEDGGIETITKQEDKIVGTKLKEDYKYDGTLRYLFNEYIPSRYTEKRKKIDFNQQTMIEIAKSYHDKHCLPGEECIIFQNEKPDPKLSIFQFSVYCGVLFTQYTFDKIVYDDDVIRNSVYPEIGAQVCIMLPRISKSLGIIADLSLSRFKIESQQVGDTRTLTKCESNILSGKLGIKYNYPKYRLRPVCILGASYHNLFNSKCEYLNLSTITQTYPLKKHFLGLYAEIGLDYKLKTKGQIFLRATCEYNFWADRYRNFYEDKINTNQIKLGYTF